MKQSFCRNLIFIFIVIIPPLAVLGQSPQTRAERTDYRETSLYADVIDFLEEAQLQATVDVMRMGFFGATREGRELPYVVLSQPPLAVPAQALSSGKPIVFIMNNIHGGEMDGKEASLMLIRDLTQGKYADWLDKMVLLIAPLYNADGNERIGKYNRMAQDGPEAGMGIRTNAAGYDLARDFMKLEQPEGQALAGLFTAWWPHFTIDAHTNDGSYHDYAITYAYPQNANVEPVIIDYLKNTMLPAVSTAVEKKSGFKSQVYGNFIDPFHPEAGWETYPSFPRYGDRYRGLLNRLSILIETYPYAPFKERVAASYEFFVGCLDYVAAHPNDIIDVVREAEAKTIARGLKPGMDSVGVRFEMTKDDQPVQIRSFVIKETKDAQGRVQFERTRDLTTYTAPYIGKSVASRRVARPYAYVIPRAYGNIARKLLLHGIAVEQLRRPVTTQVEVYRIVDAIAQPDPYQGHRMVQFTARLESQEMTLEQGTYVVRMAQPAANVAAFLLEPETPDGYAAWNYFDQIGEQNVIIVEDFLDRLGEEMLQKPEIRAEFEKRAQDQPSFRDSPEKRRAFFLEMSPYADPQRDVFPVYRLPRKINLATILVEK